MSDVLRRKSVDPRWRSGRSPATPDRLRERNVPHFVILCNTIVVSCPTFLEGCQLFAANGPFSGWEREGAVNAARVAVRGFATGVAPQRGASLRFAHAPPCVCRPLAAAVMDAHRVRRAGCVGW